jgi:hypothetical protein
MVRVPSKSKSTPLIIPSCRFGVLSFTSGFSFQAFFLFALLAEFPDDALVSELAIAARVGAGLAMIEAFLAISDFHLVAFHSSVPIRMITAFHSVWSYPVVFFLCKGFVPDTGKASRLSV